MIAYNSNIYIYIYMPIYVYMYIYIYVYVHSYTHIHISIYIYIYTYIYIYGTAPLMYPRLSSKSKLWEGVDTWDALVPTPSSLQNGVGS